MDANESMAGRFIKSLATLCALVAVGAGGWSVMRFLRRDAPRGAAFAIARIGAAHVRYDPAYARDARDRDGGRLDRLDLAVRFPGFTPATMETASKTPEPLLFLQLEEADPTLPPEERAAKLYVRFLEPEQWTNPGGIVMRRFQSGSPYESEELYFAPPEGRLFAARCTRPRQPPDGLPETCLNDIRVNGLDVHMRFHPDMLPEWERMVEGSRALIERMTR